MVRIGDIRFDRTELRDLLLAWLALGLAFTFFLEVRPGEAMNGIVVPELVRVYAISMVTVGSGFLLHELAHKVVAIRFGQVAAFRADYGMLGLAIASGLAGFLFAAPGAVYHRGRITERQNGLVAVAGPVTNLALAAVFLPLYLSGLGLVAEIGRWGLLVNVFLAAFNMLPFGPLDGRAVLSWSRGAFALVFLTAGALLVPLLLFVL